MGAGLIWIMASYLQVVNFDCIEPAASANSWINCEYHKAAAGRFFGRSNMMTRAILKRMSGLIVFSVVAVCSIQQVLAMGDDVEIRTSNEQFQDVAQAVEDGIINRGYVVDYHGFIGEMLERTAADVGSDKKLYKEAEFFTFCSAVLSRKVMEENIGDIAYCPYVIFVYVEDAEPDTVKIGFRRLPNGGMRDDVNSLLSEIIEEAAEGF